VLTLRRLSIATVLLLAVAAAIVAWRAPAWSADLLVRRIGALTGRAVTVESVRYALFPFRAEVHGLRVAGPEPGDPPFLEIPLLVAAPSLRPLWEQRLDLYELRAVGPRVRVRAFSEGGDDIPRLRLGKTAAAELRVRRLLIQDGELWVNHERVPLDLDLPAFEGRLAQGAPGTLTGRLAFGPGLARFGDAPRLSLSTTMDLAVRGGIFSIETARLSGPRTDLVYRGQLRFAPRIRADLELSGAIDLGIVDRHVLRTDFALQGPAHFQGWVRVEGAKVQLGGRLSGTDGSFDGIAVPRYSGDVGWDADGVHLRSFGASFLGGRGVFDVEVPKAPSQATLRAKLEGVDAERLAAYVFDLGLPALGASATGDVSLRWPRGRIRALTGELALDLVPGTDGRTPLEGHVAWHAREGTQFVDEARLRTPESEARVSGRIDTTGAADLAVEASSSDLRASDALGVRVREALHVAGVEPGGWSGSGAFSGKWRGTLARPVFQGRFSGQQVGYLGVQWGRAEWTGAVEPDRVRLDQVVVRRDGGELRMDGWMETGLAGENDALDLRVHVRGWPAPDFTRALAWDVDLDGPVTGDATLLGRRSAPTGTARFRSPAGRFSGVPYEALDVAARLRGTATEVTAGSATVAGGRVSFHGTASEDGTYDGEADARDVDMGRLAATAGVASAWRGRLSGHATGFGALDHPWLSAHVDGEDLAVAGESLGDLSADAAGSGDGTLTLAAATSGRLALTARGSVGIGAPHVAALDVAIAQMPVDPFLRAAYPAFPSTVALAAAARATITGPLADPRALVAEGEITGVDLRLPDYPVANRGPILFAVRDRRVEVRQFHLAGEGTDLHVAGTAGLSAPGTLDVSVEGAADLRALSLVSAELRGHGAARLSIFVAGTRPAPEVAGTIDLDGDGLRMRGFPHGVEDVRGRITFDAHSAQWSAVTGTLGGGAVELSGRAAHAGGHLTSFDVQGTGRGMALHYPEGLKSTVDAELRLFGDEARQWLTGSIDVRQAVWSRRYDVASELLALAPPPPRGAARLGEGVRFDVKVSAPGTLRIDNNLATLAARADLTLQGTYDAPVLLGRTEIERGRVYFQGNTYVIRRGTIDFSNPQKIDPLFDVEAEARVRSYNVVLKTQGTLERITPTLISDPPLSTVGILALLAGAEESEVERTAELRDRSELAATGAATLAAGRLSEQFGLERRASKLGLSRFSIDPTVGVRGEYRNSSVRLTAGKRITPELSVIYSQELRGSDEHLLSLEYSLSDRLSLLLTRANPGGLGFDLRLRRTR
jgi:translocation and assembly module TamB